MGDFGGFIKGLVDTVTPWVAPIVPGIAAAGQAAAHLLGDLLSPGSGKGTDEDSSDGPTKLGDNGPKLRNEGKQDENLNQDNKNDNRTRLNIPNNTEVSQVTAGDSSPTNSITSTNTVSPVVTANTSSQLEQAQEVMVQSQAQGSYDVQGTRAQSGAAFTISPVVTIPVMDQNTTNSAAETTPPTLAEAITPVAIAACIGYFGVRAVKAWRDTREQ